jgi:ferredoxin-NADP reductase
MTRTIESAHLEIDVVVERVTHESTGVLSLTLAAADGTPLPEWHAGAHIDLVLPGDMVRQYSLCSRPDAPSWRVGILREVAGRGGSAYVHDTLREGDVLLARGPRNNFPLVDAPAYLFIAGGIGVTPMLAMLRAVHASGVPSRFLYGGRNLEAMAFVDEVVADGADVVLWPEDTHGWLPLLAEIKAIGPDAAVYCCGPEPMIVAVEKTCADLGRASPHVERFAPKEVDAEAAGQDRAFTVVLGGSGDRYEVPIGKTIIEVLEGAGLSIDSSCQEGVCGTCEKRILSGTVSHRDSLLSDEEKAANECMMICVSRATSDELVLDM